MDHSTSATPYLALALICGLTSIGIVFLSFAALIDNESGITTATLIGIGAMSAGPSAMGIGIACFMSRARDRNELC
jgi:hypothetical protein